MAQFDVHRNQGALKDTIPFVVIVQSSLFDRYRRRMVVLPVRCSALPGNASTAGSHLTPCLKRKACRWSCTRWTWSP